jgi:adenylate cyclase class IV
MDNVNIEIKARLDAPDTVRNILLASGAEFIGEDRQIDTYFNVPEGRL